MSGSRFVGGGQVDTLELAVPCRFTLCRSIIARHTVMACRNMQPCRGMSQSDYAAQDSGNKWSDYRKHGGIRGESSGRKKWSDQGQFRYGSASHSVRQVNQIAEQRSKSWANHRGRYDSVIASRQMPQFVSDDSGNSAFTEVFALQ